MVSRTVNGALDFLGLAHSSLAEQIQRLPFRGDFS